MGADRDLISRRQYMAVLFVALLSQHIRVVPRALAADAGRAAFLAPILAALPVLLMLLGLSSVLRKRGEDYSLARLFTDSLGGVLGRALLFVTALWMIFYCAFLLRNIGDRFISTVYPHAAPAYFIISMGLVCTLSASGRFRTIARCAMLFRPIILFIILLTLGVALFNIDPDCLLPVSVRGLPGAGLGALRVVNILGLAVYMGFAEDHTPGSVRLRDYLPWIGLLLFISVLLCVCCVGMYGAEVTAKATLPVFLLMRDMSVFGSVERVEPLVITLWVLCDFVLISVVLFIGAKLFRLSLFPSCTERESGKKLRWLCPLCGISAVAAALFMGRDLVKMDLLSEKIIPGINLLFIFGLLPLVFLVGKLRKKV